MSQAVAHNLDLPFNPKNILVSLKDYAGDIAVVDAVEGFEVWCEIPDIGRTSWDREGVYSCLAFAMRRVSEIILSNVENDFYEDR